MLIHYYYTLHLGLNEFILSMNTRGLLYITSKVNENTNNEKKQVPQTDCAITCDCFFLLILFS